MTRYKLFEELERLCSIEKTGEYQYNKMIQSGKLINTHWDYNRGFYDVCIYYLYISGKHACRIWFGTIDDGDFGSWNYFDTKEEAINLVEKAVNIFKDIITCPTYDELNELFLPIGILFLNE
jgi:hypothetical protein